MKNRRNHIMKNQYYDETIGSYVSSQQEADSILESWIVSNMTTEEKTRYYDEKKLAEAWNKKYNLNLGGK